MCKTALTICCLLCSINVSAVTIVSYSELPGEIQTCFQTGDCVNVSSPSDILVSAADSTGAAAFQYLQYNGNGYDWKWLMRYELQSPPGTVGGSAWVSGMAGYDTVNSDDHAFTLYYDNSIYGNPPITLSMTSADLTAGGASRIVDGIEWQVDSGTLQIDPWPAAAIETYYEFHFNLLYMSYEGGSFAFNQHENRSLLFSQSTLQWTPGGDTEYSYSSESLQVQAVPLPASALLFAGGLAGVLRRRRKGYLGSE